MTIVKFHNNIAPIPLETYSSPDKGMLQSR